MKILLRKKYVFKIDSVKETYELFDSKYRECLHLTGSSELLEGRIMTLVIPKNEALKRIYE